MVSLYEGSDNFGYLVAPDFSKVTYEAWSKVLVVESYKDYIGSFLKGYYRATRLYSGYFLTLVQRGGP